MRGDEMKERNDRHDENKRMTTIEDERKLRERKGDRPIKEDVPADSPPSKALKREVEREEEVRENK